MKVLQINKYFYTKGGADAVFFNTMELLSSRGHTVIPFCTANTRNATSIYSKFFVDAPEIRDQSFLRKVLSVGRFIWNKEAARQLEKLILIEKPDIAHLHNIFNGLSLSILPILKKYRIPVVITIHDTRFICPSSYFHTRSYCRNCLMWGSLSCVVHRCYQDNFLNSLMCSMEMLHKEKLFNYNRFIDRYIFVSNCFQSFHAEKHSWFRDKGTVLYNFQPGIEKGQASCKKGEYLLFYGRITVEKGIKTLVETMKYVPDVNLIVVGTGPLLEELKCRQQSNVKFVGFKSGKELFNLVSHASFVIVPSEWEENNPLTIIESYTLGKPVIGARIGGIPEIIEEGKTGFIFEAFSKEDLLHTIKRAIKINDDKYLEMSQCAKKFADIHFSPESHYNQLINIYNSVIKEHENY